MEKEYVISDKCVECKHSVHEYNMWLCIHHKIDLETIDVSDCENFCKGVTPDYKFRMNTCKEELKRTLQFSPKIDGDSIKKTFLYRNIESIINSDYIWRNKSEK